MPTPQDRYVNVGPLRARYWQQGDHGDPIVLLHGLGGYVESWLPVLDQLSARHRVYALDLPGHGRTDKPADFDYRVERLASFVGEFMDAMGLERASLIGHSLGGGTATRLALRRPERVERLVLVGSAGLGQEAHLFLRLMTVPFLGEWLSRPSRAGTENGTKMLVHDPSVRGPELVDLDYRMAAQPGQQQAILRVVRANGHLSGQHRDLYGPNLAALSSMTLPVLILWGRQDQIIPVAHAEAAAGGFPNARVRIFENCGHLPMLERTAEFAETVLGWVTEHPSPAINDHAMIR